MNDISTQEIAAAWPELDLVHRQAIYITILQNRVRARDEIIEHLNEALPRGESP